MNIIWIENYQFYNLKVCVGILNIFLTKNVRISIWSNMEHFVSIKGHFKDKNVLYYYKNKMLTSASKYCKHVWYLTLSGRNIGNRNNGQWNIEQ